MAAAKRADWTAGAPEAPCSAEEAWIRDAKAGDRAAFGAMVRRHEATVLRVAYRLLMNTHDAQDAAQEVFVRFYRALGRFDASRPVTPWLYRVTVNVCRTQAKRRSRRRSAEDAAAQEAIRLAAPTYEYAADWLARGLAKLSPRERTALVLRDLEGLNATEAGKAMRCAPATVRTLAARARLKLKQLHDAEQRGLDT